MNNNLEWLDSSVRHAVRNFWETRNNGDGVLGGKTLHAFLDIIMRVVEESGLRDFSLYNSRLATQLPGYFRPHKSWDAIITLGDELIAAIEFKSQIGSIGNNFNNRSEEVLGSGIDLKTAIEEEAFGRNPNVFTGYLTVVEHSDSTLATPRIDMNHFQVMHGFLLNENMRDELYHKNSAGIYPKLTGISYLDRYDVMCKRLMIKNLYTAAAIVAVPKTPEDISQGNFIHVSPETSIRTFMAKLSAHCRVVAEIQEQRG